MAQRPISNSLSIIIPVWGGRAEFGACFRRNWPLFSDQSAQIVLCTDFLSADRVRSEASNVARTLGGPTSQIGLMVEKTNMRKGWLANRAFHACTSSLTLFCDCDVVLPAATLNSLVEQALLGKAAYVGRIVSEADSAAAEFLAASHLAAIRDLVELTMADGTTVTVEKSALYPVERARSGPGIVCIRSELFELIGGYNADIAGYGWEDIDLLVRLGLSAKATSVAVGHAFDAGPSIPRSEMDERLLQESRNFQLCRANYCLGALSGSLNEIPEPDLEILYPVER